MLAFCSCFRSRGLACSSHTAPNPGNSELEILVPEASISKLNTQRTDCLKPSSSFYFAGNKASFGNMWCRPDHDRLCRLINDSLRPYTESRLSLLRKDKEKDLLILLSNVLREIRRWTDELDFDSERNEAKTEAESGFSHGMDQDSGDFHDCLATTVSSLVIFLNMGNQYIRHVTSNLLVIIFDFLAKSGSECDGFLHVLIVCMEAAISNILPSSSILFVTAPTNSESDASCISFVRQRMVNADWVTVDGLTRVMHAILKHLKQDCVGETASQHMHFVICSIMNIPWDLLNDIHVMQTSEADGSGVTVSHHGKNGSPVSRFLFLGTLLQLLCSLVDQCVFGDDDRGSVQKHPVLEKISCLIAKLLSWCFDKQQDCACTGISQYLRHKTLMLMVRLSFRIPWECSTIVFWLHLLRTYFDDILCEPISRHYANFDDCLDGSPFLASIADGEESYGMHTRHLQRQAIFLLLKCSLSFIRLDQEADLKCSCATSNSLGTCDLIPDQECCNIQKSLEELSEWLQRHVPLDTFVDYEMYLERCGSFALSFLQLYMDEDDLLFEVLLQLQCFPLPTEQIEACKKYNEKGKALKEVKDDDIIFHLSNILNPLHLFHIFLAELHYDHQVLLDYLISEDIGIRCLQYLLSCLRTVSSLWHLFVEFPVCEGETSLSYKRRKISVSDPASEWKTELSLLAQKAGKSSGVVDGQNKGNQKLGCMLYDKRKRMFENAKECLLSLKQSIQNLNQKKLFPYNPTALLRSLNRFEQLCHQQEIGCIL